MTDPSHYSSVYDLARLARRAMHDARFRDIVRRQQAVVKWGNGRRVTVRVNNLLLHWDWADGIKSGYTYPARFCLVGSGRPGLRPFITATLAAPDREQDARDHVALFLWASELYEERTLLTAGDVVATVPLAGGGEVQVAAKTTLTAVVRKAARASRSLTLPARFAERPEDGAVVGSVSFRADGVALGTVRLVVVPEVSPSPEATPSPEASAQPAAAAASRRRASSHRAGRPRADPPFAWLYCGYEAGGRHCAAARPTCEAPVTCAARGLLLAAAVATVPAAAAAAVSAPHRSRTRAPPSSSTGSAAACSTARASTASASRRPSPRS